MLIHWEETNAFAFDYPSALAVLAVGSTEQHSEYLPVGTDSLIARHIAAEAAEKAVSPILLLPVQQFGFSHHHRAFAGCITLNQQTLLRLILDIGRSVYRNGVQKLLLLNSHGGNQSAMQCAVNELGAEGRDALLVRYWDLVAGDIQAQRRSGAGGMGHAGELETSLMLHYARKLVLKDRIGDRPAAVGSAWHDPDMFARNRVYRYRPFDHYSPAGNIGQPQFASEEAGARWAALITDRLAELMDDYAQNDL